MSQSPQPPWTFRSGHLALDFANTVDWHASDHPVDLLNTYADLLAWSGDFEVLDGPGVRRLQKWAREDPAAAEQALRETRELRETVYRIFSAVAGGESPRRRDLAHLADAYARAVDRAELAYGGEGGFWSWTSRPLALDAMLWPAAAAAVELLRSEAIDRVGQCRDDRGCGALFLDTSRNRSRQWCRMETCGNRAKARRHYARTQPDIEG